MSKRRAGKGRKHRPAGTSEELLHDFDLESRTLRIAFVSPEGKLLGVTYKLCPLCGITMDGDLSHPELRWVCSLCGLIIG